MGETYFDTKLFQGLSSVSHDTVQEIALSLSSLIPIDRLLLRLCIFLLCSLLLFGALRTQQSTIRAGFAVGCDCETLVACLAIVQLTRQGRLLGVHVPSHIIVIVGFSITALLPFLAFALLDLSKRLLLLSLSLLLLGCSLYPLFLGFLGRYSSCVCSAFLFCCLLGLTTTALIVGGNLGGRYVV